MRCRVGAVEYLRLRFGRWLGLAEKIGGLEWFFCITQTGHKLVAAPHKHKARRLQRQLRRDHHPTTAAAQHLTCNFTAAGPLSTPSTLSARFGSNGSVMLRGVWRPAAAGLQCY